MPTAASNRLLQPTSGPTKPPRPDPARGKIIMARVLETAETPAPAASCFKAYDLRARVPGELDATLAYRRGLADAQRFSPKRVALGRDARLSGPELQNAVAHGLAQSGAEVLDLGLCGTEEIYFAAFQPGCDGGIMITASHNPAD